MIKRYFWIALLAVGLQSSRGFALLGPQTGAGAETWQTAIIGYLYGYANTSVPGGPVFFGDIGGPHNIGEEYRRNTPVVYYTYDQTFLNFFGTYGATAVDGAYSIMNSIPAADKLDLTAFPLEATHDNYTARSLFLTDLKSVTLHLLVEQMGLADPERFVWTLHDRVVPPGCPLTTSYLVVQRNLDYQTSPLNQIQYSSYINDIFYTYWIYEHCSGINPLAVTVPFSTDPESALFTSVAANNFDGFFFSFFDETLFPHNTSGGLQIGYFYNGLTRDDVAGLKYLYTTNNVNRELPDPTSVVFTVTTNLLLQQLFPTVSGTNNAGTNGLGFYSYDGTFGYGDYGWLMATALTNNPATLQALYPGLVINSYSNYFVIATNYTYTQYFTNTGVGTVYPPVLTLVTRTNRTPYLLEKFVYKFGNVVPYRTSANTTTKRQTITVTANTGAPYPALPVTNTTVQSITYPGLPSGEFFLLPLFHTNVCPLNLLSVGLTNVLAITNFLTSANTNIVTATNTTTFSSTMIEISYFTNHIWITHPVTCTEDTNAANLYQGIGGVKFKRVDYDSLIGQFFQPITNYYNMVSLTNYQWQSQHLVRVVNRPDFLMTASDQGLPNTFNGTVTRNINYTPSPILNGLAGPGTINTPTTFDYNKIGDATWNGYDINTFVLANTNAFLYQLGEIPSLAWASFDSSTNAPILYPNGTSIATLESILTFRFTPSAPPGGQKNVYYSQVFTTGGGLLQPPLNWSASGLPPGMALATAPNGTDFILSGTPTTAGTYDFVLQLSDALGRSMQWTFTITIR